MCRCRPGAVLLLLLALGAWPREAGGQETAESRPVHKDLSQLSIEELMSIKVDTVYGASKFQQKVTEAPSSITIITADEIQKYGYRTVSDLLPVDITCSTSITPMRLDRRFRERTFSRMDVHFV